MNPQQQFISKEAIAKYFHVVKVPGDGNCLFQSLAVCLNKTREEVKTKLLNSIEDERGIPYKIFKKIEITEDNEQPDLNLNEIKKVLKTDYAWGFSAHITLARWAFDTPILIYILETQMIDVGYFKYTTAPSRTKREELPKIEKPEDIPDDAIVLLFSNGNHYDALLKGKGEFTVLNFQEPTAPSWLEWLLPCLPAAEPSFEFGFQPNKRIHMIDDDNTMKEFEREFNIETFEREYNRKKTRTIEKKIGILHWYHERLFIFDDMKDAKNVNDNQQLINLGRASYNVYGDPRERKSSDYDTYHAEIQEEIDNVIYNQMNDLWWGIVSGNNIYILGSNPDTDSDFPEKFLLFYMTFNPNDFQNPEVATFTVFKTNNDNIF